MEFHYIVGEPPSEGRNTCYLELTDDSVDYSFETEFYLWIHDDKGELHNLGTVKIGKKGQRSPSVTDLEGSFTTLGKNYFSVGSGAYYYASLRLFAPEYKEEILYSLRDVVYTPAILDEVLEEEVVKKSLLRYSSLETVRELFPRVLSGQAALTDFEFQFVRPKQKNIEESVLNFSVARNSTPSTNIHALIGRNGVGKTTLINDMINAVVSPEKTTSKFYDKSVGSDQGDRRPIDENYFSGIASVAFSPFDQFRAQADKFAFMGAHYSYIGLKKRNSADEHKTITDLQTDLCGDLIESFRDPATMERWILALDKLNSDPIFGNMELEQLYQTYKYKSIHGEHAYTPGTEDFYTDYHEAVSSALNQLSSGHAAVLQTITKLVYAVDERTLVLVDEPESHLHPPLLSAFIRALSDLLHNRNGVAIIATHSPVVLQEIPKSCVWIIDRVRNTISSRRPEIETFGENVGVLTRDIFGLEARRSGFYDLLDRAVNEGGTYDEILGKFNDQLGLEGRAILIALINARTEGC